MKMRAHTRTIYLWIFLGGITGSDVRHTLHSHVYIQVKRRALSAKEQTDVIYTCHVIMYVQIHHIHMYYMCVDFLGGIMGSDVHHTLHTHVLEWMKGQQDQDKSSICKRENRRLICLCHMIIYVHHTLHIHVYIHTYIHALLGIDRVSARWKTEWYLEWNTRC